MYNIIADLHTHTIASLHGFSTINENLTQAQETGMKYIASTDHYYQYDTNPKSNLYRNEALLFRSIRRVNNIDDRAKVINGVELNICQDIELPEIILKLPWRIASCHEWDIEDKTLEDIKKDIEYKIMNRQITAIGHPDKFLENKFDGENYKDFYEWLLNICKANDIYVELNNSSYKYKSARKYVDYWLNLAKEKEIKIYIGSDAHYFKELGKLETAIELLEKIEYPEELILNCNEEKLEKIFLNINY